MPIKKSSLEKKWYYRIAKVFFLSLPLLVVVVIFLEGYIDISGISQNNIVAILQKNSTYIVYVVMGLVLYYLILKGIWRGFLYVVFGGLEDDTKNKNERIVQQPADHITPPAVPSGQGAISDKDKKEISFYVFILIMIGLIYWIYTYKPTAQNLIPGRNNGGGNACISTGCGSQWRCDGSYYDANGIQRSLHACLPRKAGEIYSSWSGTCRQCP